MQYLLDTGVLLRLVIRSQPLHPEIRRAVGLLKERGHQLVTLSQNMAEFWNVCTRPSTARGGMGLSISSTEHRLRMLERAVLVLPDRADVYIEWKRLLLAHNVVGVQVHDARIAAAMAVQGLAHVLTLNADDFSRYGHITAVTPAEVIAGTIAGSP